VAREPQRAWWSSPERWLPMDTVARLQPAPRMVWFLVLLALVVALGAAALAIVGSSPSPAVPLLGLARNGPVIYSRDGDIFRLDPATGVTTALITGDTSDVGPYWSRDGRSIVFLRDTDDGTFVATARADGSDIRVVAGPLDEINWYDWSADGTQFALVSTVDHKGVITIARTDGSAPRTLELPLDVQVATFRGPEASELVVRGMDRAGVAALYTVSVDGTNVMQFTSGTAGGIGGYQQPITSLDGSHVAYTNFEIDPALSAGFLRVHVRDLDTEQDVVIPAEPEPGTGGAPYSQGYAAFSPDGKFLLMQRLAPNDGLEWVVGPADGSALPNRIGPAMKKSEQEGAPYWEFTPDGTAVVIPDMEQGVVLVVPVDGGEPTTLPFDGENLPSTQRLAP